MDKVLTEFYTTVLQTNPQKRDTVLTKFDTTVLQTNPQKRDTVLTEFYTTVLQTNPWRRHKVLTVLYHCSTNESTEKGQSSNRTLPTDMKKGNIVITVLPTII